MTGGTPQGEPELRVLRIIARMNVGGPALQVTALTRGLAPEHFTTRLLVGSLGPGEADYVALRAPDLQTVSVPGLGRRVDLTGDLRAFTEIRREIRDFRPHIVHTHTAKAGVLGRLAAMTTSVPITVHTFHGHLLHGYFRPAVRRAVVLTERVLARRTTHLVAVGSQVRDDLVAAGIGRATQYSVVPPGVTVATVDPIAARTELGLPLDVPVVAFVARLTAIKRPDRFIEAARQIVGQRPDVHFVVAGEGDLLEELRSAATALGDRVVFLGWRGDVETVYAACDLVMLTSDNEGMPVSLIEASCAGKPVVSTRVGSVAEVVEHGVTGVLTGDDPAELAASVVHLLDHPAEREAMGHAARERGERLFGSERLVGDIGSLYERLARERGLW